jgi:phosphoglycerate dehydrogenase-like enzyme
MRQTVMIGSPLEEEQVERIRAVDPARLVVLHAPDLLPPTRYVGDHAGSPFTRDAVQRSRWQAMLSETDILWDLPTKADLAVATRLRWIQATSTGVGLSVHTLDFAGRDVLVTTARSVHAGPLAEFVFMALLAHFRGLRHLDAEQRARRWTRYCGEEVAGRTLVVIGAGDLARGCARIAGALGMRVVAIARDPARVRAHNALFDEILPVALMHAALARADAVVVTLPHTPSTENLVDREAIAAMRPGIALVNIGRGTVVDETALIAALAAGHIGFAALDVARVEPLPPDSPLWSMPNVLISPHSASTVRTENAKITDIFIYNLRCWLDGRRDAMRNVLDQRLMY